MANKTEYPIIGNTGTDWDSIELEFIRTNLSVNVKDFCESKGITLSAGKKISAARGWQAKRAAYASEVYEQSRVDTVEQDAAAFKEMESIVDECVVLALKQIKKTLQEPQEPTPLKMLVDSAHKCYATVRLRFDKSTENVKVDSSFSEWLKTAQENGE
jgi:hypothetical protein